MPVLCHGSGRSVSAGRRIDAAAAVLTAGSGADIVAEDDVDAAENSGAADATKGADGTVDAVANCPLGCDDGEVCTTDSCANGACVNLAKSATCSDGSPGTIGDAAKPKPASPAVRRH